MQGADGWRVRSALWRVRSRDGEWVRYVEVTASLAATYADNEARLKATHRPVPALHGH